MQDVAVRAATTDSLPIALSLGLDQDAQMAPLLLGYHARSFRRTLRAPRLGFFYTLGQVTGQKVSVPDLMQELAKLRRSDVVRWIAGLSAWTTDEEGMKPQTQLSIAYQVLEDDLFKRLRQLANRPENQDGAVFVRRPLWFLMQLAMLACSESTPACEENALKKTIGRCCLMANDVLKQVELSQLPDPDATQDPDSWIATTLLPTLHDDAGAEILARAQLFWFDMTSEPTIQKHAKETGISADFNESFGAKYGIPLQEFRLILLTCYSMFLQESTKREPFLLEPQVNFKGGFAEDHLTRALAHISQTPEELAISLLSQPRQTWAFDFTPVRRKPLLQVFPGKYACPDLELLYRFFTDGIYWMLNDVYPPRSFRQLFGYLFARYIERLISRFMYSGDLLAKTYYATPKFQGKNDEVCDGLIHWVDTAVLMEVKAGLLTTRQKYAGKQDDTISGIEDLIARNKQGGKKGTGQLAHSIRKVLRGEKIFSGSAEIDLSQCKCILPVIVVYEEALGIHAIRNLAEDRFREALRETEPDDGRIGPLLIFTVRDIESLESFGQMIGLESLFLDYANFVRTKPCERIGSFGSYLSNRFPNRSSGNDSLIDTTFQSVLDEAAKEMKKRLPSLTLVNPEVP